MAKRQSWFSQFFGGLELTLTALPRNSQVRHRVELCMKCQNFFNNFSKLMIMKKILVATFMVAVAFTASAKGNSTENLGNAKKAYKPLFCKKEVVTVNADGTTTTTTTTCWFCSCKKEGIS
jgi:hypothetical protein